MKSEQVAEILKLIGRVKSRYDVTKTKCDIVKKPFKQNANFYISDLLNKPTDYKGELFL